MKNFIAINTVTDICSVSLFISNKLIQTIEKHEKHSQTKYLASFFQKLLKLNNITLEDLDFIALSVGPGSYAGIKVGVSFVKAISFVTDISVITINQFDSFNENINNNKNYYIALYSHRDNIYYQLYNNGKPISKATCSNYNKLNAKYKIYGYMLDEIRNLQYINIIPSSIDIGEIALKRYSPKILKNADNIESTYLAKSD